MSYSIDILHDPVVSDKGQPIELAFVCQQGGRSLSAAVVSSNIAEKNAKVVRGGLKGFIQLSSDEKTRYIEKLSLIPHVVILLQKNERDLFRREIDELSKQLGNKLVLAENFAEALQEIYGKQFIRRQ